MKFPNNSEQLAKDYDQYIKDWILAKNTANLDSDEFISSFYFKVHTKDTLNKFDQDRGIKFKTWLSRVLQNHYYDLINSSLKDKWNTIHSDDETDRPNEENLEDKTNNPLEEIIQRETIQQLIRLINGIPDDRDRILIKLKFYQKGQSQLIQIEKNDIKYIKEQSSLNENEIIEFAEKNAKPSYGLKDKDICELMSMSPGSINTFFQRAVRKWLRS